MSGKVRKNGNKNESGNDSHLKFFWCTAEKPKEARKRNKHLPSLAILSWSEVCLSFLGPLVEKIRRRCPRQHALRHTHYHNGSRNRAQSRNKIPGPFSCRFLFYCRKEGKNPRFFISLEAETWKLVPTLPSTASTSGFECGQHLHHHVVVIVVLFQYKCKCEQLNFTFLII